MFEKTFPQHPPPPHPASHQTFVFSEISIRLGSELLESFGVARSDDVQSAKTDLRKTLVELARKGDIKGDVSVRDGSSGTSWTLLASAYVCTQPFRVCRTWTNVPAAGANVAQFHATKKNTKNDVCPASGP